MELERLGEHEDDGTMPASLRAIEKVVVGRRIVGVESLGSTPGEGDGIAVTLDNGMRAKIRGVGDCCAYTEIESFLMYPEMVDHVITGVGTTGNYTTWHIYADMGDVLRLRVEWSCGNPFYYGYGFTVEVEETEWS